MIEEERRRIILKADDRGNQEAICEGIDYLVEQGFLTDVAIIIQWTGSRERDLLLEAISRSPLRNEPGIGIILHVNLVSGEPLSDPKDIPSLVDTNGFLIRPAVTTRTAWQDYTKNLVPDQVRREIEAQINRFTEVFGHLPHALDSHHMILAAPPADEIAMEIALDMRVPITVPKTYTDELTKGPFSDVFEVDRELLQKYHNLGISTVDWEEVEYWNRLNKLEDSVSRFVNALLSVKPGITSFFFHPGHPDYLGKVDERFDRGRIRDFQILTHPKVRQAIASLTLTSYWQLFNLAQQAKR